VSDWVTWESCFRCAGPAAVGWVGGGRIGSAAEHLPVEFDCTAGCGVGRDELAQAYCLPARGTRLRQLESRG